MTDLDLLFDIIVSDAMLDDGTSPDVLQSRGGVIRAKKKQAPDKQQTRWTDAEDQFLQDNLGKMPLAEIAKALGRSKEALKTYFTRKGYPAPSKLPGWISLSQAGRLLGVENHVVPGWFRHGIIPGRYAFTKNRKVAIIKFTDLKFWATRPEHWPYFNVDQMPPGHLRRLVQKAQDRWGDEWITTRQVADMHGLNPRDIARIIYKGQLPAIQCKHIGGRDSGTWAFWFVKKSDALTYVHKTSKGPPRKDWYTPQAEAFLQELIKAGKKSPDAARLMKQDQKYLSYKMFKLRKLIND